MGRNVADYPKPASWQDFDRLSRSLMSAVHGVKFERWGPLDHREHGADAWAMLPNGKAVVLQCKGRSRSFGKSLSIANLDAAVRELDSFPHPVQELIILTTTPETVALQDRAEDLTEQRAKAGLSRVSLYGWHSIGELIGRHETVLADYRRPRHAVWRRVRLLVLLVLAIVVTGLAFLPGIRLAG